MQLSIQRQSVSTPPQHNDNRIHCRNNRKMAFINYADLHVRLPVYLHIRQPAIARIHAAGKRCTQYASHAGLASRRGQPDR